MRKLIKPGINSRVNGKIVKCYIKDPKVINEEEYMLNCNYNKLLCNYNMEEGLKCKKKTKTKKKQKMRKAKQGLVKKRWIISNLVY